MTLCASCGHTAGNHCDGIGRCNVMVVSPELSLIECNCPNLNLTEETV